MALNLRTKSFSNWLNPLGISIRLGHLNKLNFSRFTSVEILAGSFVKCSSLIKSNSFKLKGSFS